MPLIYLAGAIDRVEESPATWVEAVKVELFHIWRTRAPLEPLAVYSPYMAFQEIQGILDQEHAIRLLRINMHAVIKADLLLVHYQPGVETWGTPMEVLRAHAHGISIMVWKSVTAPLPSYLRACAGDHFCFGPTGAAEGAFDFLQRRIDVKKEE